jgi:hypothetical protein
MMGRHARSESLFYYFRLEDQVPENHLLRLIDQHIACIWHGAGSQVSVSMRKFRITPRFRRIATDVSRNRGCSNSCSSESWRSAWKLAWCAETSYRSMEPSLKPMLRRRAASRENSWQKLRRSIERCANISLNCETQNPVEEPTHSQDKVSTTDPDSTYATKAGTPARMGYYNNYLTDNHSCIVVGVQATGARLSEESRAAEDMIARFAQ